MWIVLGWILPSLVAYFTKNAAVEKKEFLFVLQYEEQQINPSDNPRMIATLFAFSRFPGKNYEVASTPLEDLLYERICTQEQFFLMNERLQKRTPGFDTNQTLKALNANLSNS